MAGRCDVTLPWMIAPGIIPEELSLEERLAWYYKQHDPDKVKDAQREAREAIEYDAEDVLLERLR